MDRYIVMTAAEKMPIKCWGRYGKVAVVELEPGFDGSPKMISERARGVKRVVAIWPRQHIGKTDRSAFYVALSEAGDLADELNAAE